MICRWGTQLTVRDVNAAVALAAPCHGAAAYDVDGGCWDLALVRLLSRLLLGSLSSHMSAGEHLPASTGGQWRLCTAPGHRGLHNCLSESQLKS